MTESDKPATGMDDDVRRPFITLLVITAILLAIGYLRAGKESAPSTAGLSEFRVESINELEEIFAQHDYDWPPSDPVPRLAVERLPSNMAALKVDRKKSLFFRTVLPLILAENRRIREQRRFIQHAFSDYASLTEQERQQITDIAREYKVEGNLADSAVQKQLLRRVDIIPVALALAQAANESAWGGSRFAIEGNSLFGVWTWEESKGIKPKRREKGKTHLVRSYIDLRASVRAYMHTLNVGRAYLVFRQRRREMRINDEPLDALALAGLLDRYSERGMAYVAELRQIILGNGLNRLAHLRLEG